MRPLMFLAAALALGACAPRYAQLPDPDTRCRTLYDTIAGYEECIHATLAERGIDAGAPGAQYRSRYFAVLANLSDQVRRGEATDLAALDTAAWYYRRLTDEFSSSPDGQRIDELQRARAAAAYAEQQAGVLMMMQGLATLSAANRPVYHPPAYVPLMRQPFDCTAIRQGAFVNTHCY